jgi:uracil-DNA glycosylase
MSTPAITKFLTLLRKSPRRAVFNPWWQIDAENDIGASAARIRREQLDAYFSERIAKAQLALIGEALSYRGGHFTGIAMTSERLLLEGDDDAKEPARILAGFAPRRTSKPQRNPRGFSEPTATIVWSVMRDLHVPAAGFVLWNAFPWHPFDPHVGMLSNRKPTKAELAAGGPVLDAFLQLFPCEKTVAVGRLAAAQLVSRGFDIKAVRHPASGGAPLFRKQIAGIVRAR